MTTIGTPLDTSWMTPWEQWAWEQIRTTGNVDLEAVPEASRGSEDIGKAPVARAIIKLTDGLLEPVDPALWPAWQVLSPRFLETILLRPDFVHERLVRPVSLMSARVSGPVNLEDATLDGSLNFGFMRFDDAIRLKGAEVKGGVAFRACHMLGGLVANEIRITGGLSISMGSIVVGEVGLRAATIGSNLDLIGSMFGAVENGRCIAGDNMTVRGDVYLRGGSVCIGDLGFPGAELMQDLHICDSAFNALFDLASAKIRGEVRLDEQRLRMGPPHWGTLTELNFQNAKVGALQGSLEAWKCGGGFVPRNLDGLSVERLSGGTGGASLDRASARDIIAWIEQDTEHSGTNGTFSPSPYLAVAKALETAGAADKARKVRIAHERRITRSMSWLSLSAPNKLGRTFVMGPMTAYGYEPMRATFWFAGLVILFALVGLSWELAAAPEYAPPAIRDMLAWLGFSFESALPLIELDPVPDTFLEDRFGVGEDAFGNKLYDELPNGLRALFAAERILGLIILSVLVAGLTGWAETRGK